MMNLLNKLFKKKEKPTCIEYLKEFLDEPSLYPKSIFGDALKSFPMDKDCNKLEELAKRSCNDSIAWICRDLKHGIKIKKLLDRPQISIKEQIKDICKFYEYLESEHPSPEDQDVFINKLINDQEEQNNDQD